MGEVSLEQFNVYFNWFLGYNVLTHEMKQPKTQFQTDWLGWKQDKYIFLRSKFNEKRFGHAMHSGKQEPMRMLEMIK
jgi:hypothetical protein